MIVELRNARIIKRARLPIDQQLCDQAEVQLFLNLSPRLQDAHRDRIERIKEVIDERGVTAIPPIVFDMDQERVIDGDHTVIAFWENGITHHMAIWVRER